MPSVQLRERACLLQAAAGREEIYLRLIHFPLILSGAMASSAVCSVLNLRDAGGNDAETRAGAYIYYADAASFHEWVLRTRLRIAVKNW